MECAAAIGLDADYLKKMEEQKRLREEVQRKKLKKLQDIPGDETRNKEERPSRKRSRSPDKRGSRSDKSRRHHHHHRKHRRDRASSLERIAEHALKVANAAIMPAGSALPPGIPMGMNPMSLPPMSIPPPVIPVQPGMAVSSAESNPAPVQQQQPHQPAPQVPVLRTVSTATIAGPMMPKIVKYQPPPDAKEKNLKAHLVVVVGNVSRLQNAFKRISLFASSVGDTKVGLKLSKCRDYCNLYKLFDFILFFVREIG